MHTLITRHMRLLFTRNASETIKHACKNSMLAIILLTLMSYLAFAQQGRGAIQGTVVDDGGAAIAGAQVTVTSLDTNLSFTAVTGAEGFFLVPNLIVGNYSVTVTRDGFKKSIQRGIVLEVDQKAEINLTLEPGAVNESVVVNAESPLIDTTTATVGKVIENRPVQDLPVNGRNALALVLLTPAVQSAIGPEATGFADRGTQVSSIRINGSPVATNNFLVDGLSSINAYLPDVNINPTVDAVQEFKVMTNTMSAEYGFTLGGVVNLVTKSGTNQYHGSLYEFLRNDALDSNTWANNRVDQPKTPLRYNQFGGAIGGPIHFPKKVFGPAGYDGHDRSFFFFNYEGYRFITSGAGFYTMPTEAMRNGDFSQLRNDQGQLITIYDPATTRPNPNFDPTRAVTGANQPYLRDPFPGNIIPANRINPVANNLLRFYPLPNRTPENPFSNHNNYYGAVSNHRTLDQYTSRVDHRFSDQNNLMGRYTFYRQFTDNGLLNLYPDPTVRDRNDPFRGHNVVLEDIQDITPHLINTVRLGVARQSFTFTVASAGQNLPEKLGLPSIVPPDTIPIINNGLPVFDTGTVGVRGGEVWQFYDSLNLLRGNHSFKIGTELRLTQANNLQEGSPSGNYTFSAGLTNNAVQTPGGASNTGNSFATFLLGEVSSASVKTDLGESEVGKSYSFFFQDDWKATRHLTINLGVRYDYQQMPYERNCGTSNFDPYAINPTNNLPGQTEYACVDYGRTAMKSDNLNFAPRLGFALDLFGNQRTVLRGGYSIFYPDLFAFYTNIYGSTNGFASTTTTYNPPNGNPVFPSFDLSVGFPSNPTQPLGAQLGPNFFATGGANYQEADGSTPMSQQWNFSVQQQLPLGILLEATYTGNHSTHLFAGSYDLNQADPSLVALYGLQGTLNESLPNPYAGQVPGQFGGSTINLSQLIRPYPYIGTITVRSPRLGDSIYHALLLSAEKRFSKGFSFLASYTYGKLISDSVSDALNFIPTEGAGVFGYQNGKFNRAAERSEDPSDVPQRLVISALWELPIGGGRRLDLKNRALNTILGNWQINTVTTIASGPPLAVTGANNGLASRPNLVSAPQNAQSSFQDPLNPQGIDRGILWFNPSSFLNPPDYTYGNASRALPGMFNPGAIISDLSIFKNFSLTEKIKLQFRVEAFNFLNHTNLLGPNTSFGNNAGEVTANGLPVTVSSAGVATITGTTPITYGNFCMGPSQTVKLNGANSTVYRNQCNTSSSFGYIISARDPRQVQLGLKLTF